MKIEKILLQEMILFNLLIRNLKKINQYKNLKFEIKVLNKLKEPTKRIIKTNKICLINKTTPLI